MADPKDAHVTLDILHVPEALAAMRREIARFTRRVACGEPDPLVARRLRQIAAAFEAGQTRLDP